MNDIAQNLPELSIFCIGMTQVFKMAGLPSQFLPAICVALGALFYVAENGINFFNVIHGALAGLVLTGLVSATDDRLGKINPSS